MNIENKLKYFTYEFVEKITSWKNKWNVSYHINHACHIHCKTRNMIIFCYNIADDTVLDPLHCIACTVYNKYS